jgi:hypothetical protein
MDSNYGTRRKRNIDMSRFYREDETKKYSATGWINEKSEEDTELEVDYEEVEEITEYDSDTDEDVEETSEEGSGQYFIDGKQFVAKEKPKKALFMETHIRYTTYIDKNVMRVIRLLQENGQIESITTFINDGIKEHLFHKYSNNK